MNNKELIEDINGKLPSGYSIEIDSDEVLIKGQEWDEAMKKFEKKVGNKG